MKFEKHVKNLGVHGVIQERSNGERWISGNWSTLKVPENVSGFMAKAIVDMPRTIEDYINYEHTGVSCELHRALMPAGDSGIKDCIRMFLSETGEYECGIRNNDFALIEKSDVVEMYIGQNNETFEDEPKALLIKRFVADIREPELVGVILIYRFED